MLEKLVAVLHIAPFFTILILMAYSFLYQKITKNSIKSDLSSTILLLTAIGVAFGFGTHHYHLGGGSCYICFGYALILLSVAYNTMRAARKVTKEV